MLIVTVMWKQDMLVLVQILLPKVVWGGDLLAMKLQSNLPNAYVNSTMAQTQTRGLRAPVPQSMELAHPPDLLDHISLAVSSLETFQLRELLSTAALRHPDVLGLLRTSFGIQETHKTTAHQAL